MDIVLAKRAYSESSYAIAQNGDDWMWGYPDRHINDKILKAAEEMDVPVTVGAIHSTDIFYRESTGKTGIGKIVRENELLCVEMEAFALFHNAKVLDKNAACLLTISNSFMKHEELTNKERETGFETMAVLALESVLKL